MGIISFISNIFTNNLSKDKINNIINCIISNKDKDLVLDEDIIWVSNLKKYDIEKILQEDEMFRMARFKLLRDSGLDPNNIIKSILHDFPLFYLDKNTRENMPGNEDIWKTLDDDDMRLPFCIKNRFNKLLMMAQYGDNDDSLKNTFKYYVGNSRTINSAIRKMIRFSGHRKIIQYF